MLQYIAVLGGYSDMQRSGFTAEVPTLFKQDPWNWVCPLCSQDCTAPKAQPWVLHAWEKSKGAGIDMSSVLMKLHL